MSAARTPTPQNGNGSGSQAWLRALERTAPIARHRDRLFPAVIEELAVDAPDSKALLSDDTCMTFGELADRANRYARWALKQGVAKGDVVCLLMPNCPEYLAIWLGITKVGGVVALLNTNQFGTALAHSINIVAPKHIIVGSDLVDALAAIQAPLTSHPIVWDRIELEIERYSGDSLSEAERRPVTIDDRALHIYTSGTTGLPKAANVSHARVMQWSEWFAGMMDTGPTDRMYDCLPMYHSVGGVLAPAAVLASGGSVVIRENFSASHFWKDIVDWDCSLFQYIGEICRYLLHTGSTPNDTGHRIRMACGNGLRPNMWEAFQSRFRIPQIFEFYAATEGGVSLFNIEGQCGAIGRIPAYLTHRFSPALVKFDVETDQPVRNEQGFCVPCVADEVGEVIGRAASDSANPGGRFEGYTDNLATEKRILRNVFRADDAWVRTGDLMRKDRRGFFYFVDRVGDTFRWKGENVATSEVSEAICSFPGVRHANVYGVTIPGADGRAGMAALVMDGNPDLEALRIHLTRRLPGYARPLFLRVRKEMRVTGTFKFTKADLVLEGYDVATISDALYFDDPEKKAFVRLDRTLYERIQAGQVRL
jgi:fatty-acyl-CoA synthase